jgi:hypothetical protein
MHNVQMQISDLGDSELERKTRYENFSNDFWMERVQFVARESIDSVEAQFLLTGRIPSPARMGRPAKVSDVNLNFIHVRTPQAGEPWK